MRNSAFGCDAVLMNYLLFYEIFIKVENEALRGVYFLRKRGKNFNPLNPNVKIQILICYPYTFPIAEVGRIC